MSTSTQLPEGDLAAPATTGQLLLVKSELEGKVDGATAELNAKIDRVASDLNSRMDRATAELTAIIESVRSDLQIAIRDVHIAIRDVRLGTNRVIWVVAAILGAVGILLRYF